MTIQNKDALHRSSQIRVVVGHRTHHNTFKLDKPVSEKHPMDFGAWFHPTAGHHWPPQKWFIAALPDMLCWHTGVEKPRSDQNNIALHLPSDYQDMEKLMSNLFLWGSTELVGQLQSCGNRRLLEKQFSRMPDSTLKGHRSIHRWQVHRSTLHKQTGNGWCWKDQQVSDGYIVQLKLAFEEALRNEQPAKHFTGTLIGFQRA